MASGPGAAGIPAASCQPSDGTQPPSNSMDGLRAVAVVSACDVWAVGNRQSGTSIQTLIEHWTGGKTWTVVPSPNPDGPAGIAELRSVSAVSASDIWAVGSNTDQNGLNSPGAGAFGMVPDVIGKDQLTATSVVQNAGLGVTITAAIATPPVNLKVCKIPNVPDLTGDTTAKASTVLASAGLVLGTVRTLTDPVGGSIGK